MSRRILSPWNRFVKTMSDIRVQRIPSGRATRTFLDGSEYWSIDLPTVRMGLGHFRPGWVWSKHAGPQHGKSSEMHIGYIQSGTMAVLSADGHEVELGPGDAFEVGPGHDAWVVGDQPCVALDVSLKPPANPRKLAIRRSAPASSARQRR